LAVLAGLLGFSSPGPWPFLGKPSGLSTRCKGKPVCRADRPLPAGLEGLVGLLVAEKGRRRDGLEAKKEAFAMNQEFPSLAASELVTSFALKRLDDREKGRPPMKPEAVQECVLALLARAGAF